MRLVVTPNDVVFYRPFETYERSLRDARGDVSLFIAPSSSTSPTHPWVGPTRGVSSSLAGSRVDSTRATPCSSRRRRSS